MYRSAARLHLQLEQTVPVPFPLLACPIRATIASRHPRLAARVDHGSLDDELALLFHHQVRYPSFCPLQQVDLSVKEAYCIGVGFGIWLKKTGLAPDTCLTLFVSAPCLIFLCVEHTSPTIAIVPRIGQACRPHFSLFGSGCRRSFVRWNMVFRTSSVEKAQLLVFVVRFSRQQRNVTSGSLYLARTSYLVNATWQSRSRAEKAVKVDLESASAEILD